MPRHLQKSLQDYLSKIKRETGKIQLSSNSFSSSKNWVLSGCKHPKTLSFSINRNHRKHSSKSKSKDDDENDHDSGHAATLSDIDRFLEENFKSLCIRDDDDDDDDDDEDDDHDEEDVDADSELDPKNEKKKKKIEESENDDDDRDRFERAWGPALYDSPKPSDATADPRRSELLAEEARRSMATTTTTTTSALEEIPSSSNSSTYRYGGRAGELPENCIAVLRYTPDPQEDFRRSMVEMVEARLGMRESEVDWDFMEELLFCYLDLNDKKSHRFILSAFVDLIVVLRQQEKSITRNGLIRSLSTRLARDRLRRRMSRPS